MRRLPRRAAVERAVGTLLPVGERGSAWELDWPGEPEGPGRVAVIDSGGLDEGEADVSRLWDGVALWVALWRIEEEYTGAPFSYWPHPR